MEFSNQLMSDDQIPDLFASLDPVSYAAAFHLVCIQPTVSAHIHIAGNPYYQTFLVLDDGYGERLFQSVQGLKITMQPADRIAPKAPAKPAKPSRTWGHVKTAFYRR